ncbi:hypothetical protein XH94_26030, partial [Bradyrhizobium zhanjiangense]
MRRQTATSGVTPAGSS